MADETLRLPNSIFRAVLDLGPKRAASITLPKRLAEPDLFAEWQQSDEVSTVYVEFDDGQLHLDCSRDEVEYHFHGETGGDDGTEVSPWPPAETALLVEWATLLTKDFHARMPELMEDIEEAAAWQDAGFDLYVCVTEPTQLDLLEVEIEGEIMTLPWLGAGQVSHEHLDGDNHPVGLVWSLTEGGPGRSIARAWLDLETSEPATAAENGVDWEAVGMPRDEVLVWLEGTYVNNHVIPDAASALIQAALERMGGLDREESY